MLLLIVKPKCAGNDPAKYIYIISYPVDKIPDSETGYNEITKDIKCTEGLKPAYVPDRSRNVTVLGCFENKRIFNHYCPELNQGTLQENFYASCANFSPSCPSPYYVWESFKYPDCFRNNTGIEQEKEEKTCYCTSKTWLLIMLIISLGCNACQIAHSVKRCLYRRRNSNALQSSVEIQNLMENELSIQLNNSTMENNSKDTRKVEEDAQEPLKNGTLHDEHGALIQDIIPSSDIVAQESLSEFVEIEN